MSNRAIKCAGIGVAAAIILILLGAYIFNIREKTPEYSMQMIEESINNHDKSKFENYVDMDQLLNNTYDSFVDGMMDSDKVLPPDIKDSITNFAQLLKMPMITSMKQFIMNYIETGDLDNQYSDNDVNQSDESFNAVKEIFDRAGLNKIEFRQIGNIKIDDNNQDQAIAEVAVYQKDAEREFIFEAVLEKDSSKQWRIVDIKNFRDFIAMVNLSRHTQIDKYLDETEAIITRHDKTIRDAEQKYGSIVAIASTLDESKRADLKTLMTDVIKKDWEVRKQELFNVSVPKGAEPLQHVRIKICDLSIDCAEIYANWLGDKKAATLKEAEDINKQIQTLMEEEKILLNRLKK